jgi:two-component system sensor histidine kinase/response regulator
MDTTIGQDTTILIVDDDEMNLKYLSSLLKNYGYTTIPVNNGYDALLQLDNTIPDLILLDVAMPEMDGFETCKRIKERPEFMDIPIIFLTGRNYVEDLVKGFESGGIDYIIKPFIKEELLLRIRTHVELKKTRDMMKQQTEDLKKVNIVILESVKRFTNFMENTN